MAEQNEATSLYQRKKQLGEKNLKEWDIIHNLAELIKQGKAKIVKGSDGAPFTTKK